MNMREREMAYGKVYYDPSHPAGYAGARRLRDEKKRR